MALLGALAIPASAQNGTNFHVLNNGLDVIYGGIGAGGTQVPRVDGIGYWVGGEDIKGSTLVPGVIAPPGPEAFFGYKQAGLRWTMCVLGPPIAGLSLNMPSVTIVEFRNRNNNAPDVFLRPGCTTGGGINGLTTGGVLPYGGPNGTSVSFVLSGLPSGATGSATGISSSQVVLLPNGGLIPSARNGIATIIGAASANLPINSTGFCWTVQFTWLNSALAPTCLAGTADDVDGWWTWLANGSAGNQYWGMSNDELNAFQSRSIALDGGATALIAFFANLDFVAHHMTCDPYTNDALQPAGFNATGVYYATSTARAGGGAPVPNGGFDLGRHVGTSTNGTGGVTNPITLLGNQNPANNALGSIPSVGYVTWSNANSNGAGVCDDVFSRLTWVQFNWDTTFGIDPGVGRRLSPVTFFFGLLRLGINIPISIPAPWPQPFTTAFFPFYVHTATSQLGNALWPDPDGFPGGTFGICPIVGGSLHIPFVGFGPVCAGVPLAWGFCTSGTGPIANTTTSPLSNGAEQVLLD